MFIKKSAFLETLSPLLYKGPHSSHTRKGEKVGTKKSMEIGP
jgi:hypothetical protein